MTKEEQLKLIQEDPTNIIYMDNPLEDIEAIAIETFIANGDDCQIEYLFGTSSKWNLSRNGVKLFLGHDGMDQERLSEMLIKEDPTLDGSIEEMLEKADNQTLFNTYFDYHSGLSENNSGLLDSGHDEDIPF
jgi:hypothetical protein